MKRSRQFRSTRQRVQSAALYNTLLTSRPGSIRAFVCEASFWDIGTVTDYWQTSLAFSDAPRPHAIVWDDVEIGEGACWTTASSPTVCGFRRAAATARW